MWITSNIYDYSIFCVINRSMEQSGSMDMILHKYKITLSDVLLSKL